MFQNIVETIEEMEEGIRFFCPKKAEIDSGWETKAGRGSGEMEEGIVFHN